MNEDDALIEVSRWQREALANLKGGNMKVTYRYSSLTAIADYYDNKAVEERSGIARASRKKDADARRERASVYEAVAYMLRNTELAE